ncbi:hypothetical protein VM1G_05550 [Cytospora mali]|uniref:Heterokaryon incompatibility domain-containing protein n=1 Tax=Cytospora mali TaxID=578113 RepID=A0A194VZE8_CYTMA|nr:hypothetical protein VM1G_05550 [Valsa mali]
MTSHQYQREPDASRYGEYLSPMYYALSYTWGRWELEPDRSPETKALDVANVSWPIPRIRPDRFTAAQFQRVLQNVLANYMVPKVELSGGHHNMIQHIYSAPQSEFVWLDVACIDQTPGSPLKAQEIGRQARIFRGAEKVFIWLHGIEPSVLWRAVSGLFRAGGEATWIYGREPGQLPRLRGPVLRGDEDFLAEAVTSLQDLLTDPWFSSLWTLQEAFLSPAAEIVDKDGQLLYDLRSGGPGGVEARTPIDLQSISRECVLLARVCSRSVAIKKQSTTISLPPCELEESLLALIEKSGLATLALRNPMALYTMSRKRTTRDPCDRIYGIMQVFDFQLGSSAPAVDPGKSFTLPELEIQLGEELFRGMPLLSQVVVHTEVVPFGHAWRVQASSTMPSLADHLTYYRTSSIWGAYEPRCNLSTSAQSGTTWGRFGGVSIPFSELVEICRIVNEAGFYQYRERISGQEVPYEASEPNGNYSQPKSCFQLALDMTELTIGSPYLSSLELSNISPHQQNQQSAALELASVCEGKHLELRVILLGQYVDERRDRWDWGMTEDKDFSRGEKWNVGILLSRPFPSNGVSHLNQENVKWRRLGVMIWDLANNALTGRTSKEKEYLLGEGRSWEKTEGLFG